MAGRDLIVIGTSSGGVGALSTLARNLPASFPSSLFVVCHLPAAARSRLPEILSQAGPLLATHPTDGEPFYPGHIYVAPPDHHLLLSPDGRMRLTRGARENHHRPAVDPLFRSAARYFGERVIGVVLTGALHDGTAGLMAIRNAGGLAIIQDPEEATVAAMPQSALTIAGVDHIVSLAELAPLLMKLVEEPPKPKNKRTNLMDRIDHMSQIAAKDMALQESGELQGSVSVFTCPECGGALWQVDEANSVRFRCHVGHLYEGEVLLSEQTEALEAALWTAVRTFREKSVLSTQLANRERAGGNASAAERFDEQAAQAAQFGNLIQHYLLQGQPAAGL
ncbi:MAG TPA: chemotaxis protein CheB [Isosphaeraceae bacterium]|nr:chemotaxis protein CheB [Isosphaeraceae bacterium]